jgi:hypothetical protein
MPTIVATSEIGGLEISSGSSPVSSTPSIYRENPDKTTLRYEPRPLFAGFTSEAVLFDRGYPIPRTALASLILGA